jgi:hypothetical protein
MPQCIPRPLDTRSLAKDSTLTLILIQLIPSRRFGSRDLKNPRIDVQARKPPGEIEIAGVASSLAINSENQVSLHPPETQEEHAAGVWEPGN